jgi:hypothetical protein
MASHHRASWARVQVRVLLVALEIFRHKVVAGDLHLSGLALRHLQRVRVQMSIGHHRGFVSLVVRSRLLAGLRAKRAAREKGDKAPMVSPAGHHHQEVEHPPRERNAANSSHNTERNNQRKERPGQGHNNSAAICDSGSGEKNSGAAFSGCSPKS